MKTKVCPQCGEEKEIEQFNRRGSGRQSWCKVCHGQSTSEQKKEAREQMTHRNPRFEFDPILKQFLRDHARKPNCSPNLVTISAYPQAGMNDEGIIITSSPRERVVNSVYGHPMIGARR